MRRRCTPGSCVVLANADGMRKINTETLDEIAWASPKGKFARRTCAGKRLGASLGLTRH